MEATVTKATFQKYLAYQDSGVDWLEELPKNWDEVPLFTLTKLKSVINCSELELLSVYLDLGVIKFSDVEAKRTNVTSQDLSKYQRVDIGDFVLNNQQAWRGSVGVSNHQGIVSPAYLVLELSKKLHTEYANYMFRSGYMVGQYLINSKGVGTIQRNLYWPSLRRAKVILPPLPEQTAIAKFLDDKTAKIDRAIAQKEKMITLLKERKQIIIQDFVKGKKVWNEKQNAWTEPAEVKDSGVEWIGEIPEHWEVKRLKYLTSYFKGFAFKSQDFAEEQGIPIVKASNIKDWEISNVKSFIAFDNQKEEFSRFKLSEGNIIISTVGSKPNIKESAVGQLAFVNESFNSAYLNQNTVCFKGNHQIEKAFLKYVFVSKYMRDSFDRISLWIANQAYLEVDTIREQIVPLPPLKEQTTIVAFIEAQSIKIDKVMRSQQQQIEKLKELKSTLIDSAVTGKIKII